MLISSCVMLHFLSNPNSNSKTTHNFLNPLRIHHRVVEKMKKAKVIEMIKPCAVCIPNMLEAEVNGIVIWQKMNSVLLTRGV